MDKHRTIYEMLMAHPVTQKVMADIARQSLGSTQPIPPQSPDAVRQAVREEFGV